jgi:hypothetical protein
MKAQRIETFFPERFPKMLEEAKDLPDIFEVVKEAVRAREGWSRSGLMLGLVEMGGDAGIFIGGLHPVGTNIIVLNKTPLRRIRESYPHLCKPYVFHVLMHEYIHTIGVLNEKETRDLALKITLPLFGAEHLATKFAEDMSQFLPFITYPLPMRLPEGVKIELVHGFDRSSTAGYIG